MYVLLTDGDGRTRTYQMTRSAYADAMELARTLYAYGDDSEPVDLVVTGVGTYGIPAERLVRRPVVDGRVDLRP